MSRSLPPIRNFAFVCERVSALVSGEVLLKNGFGYRTVNCIGQVGTGAILQAIEYGADQVVLFGCAETECRHEIGAQNARKQVETSRQLLNLMGFTPEAVRFIPVSARSGHDDLFSIRLASNRTSGQKVAGGIEPEKDDNFASAGTKVQTDFVCIDCGRCSGVCPVARTGLGFSPRRLMQKAATEGAQLKTRVLYACLGCDLCKAVCPSGKSIAEEILGLRAIAFQEGAQPVMAHDGVVQTLSRMMAKTTLPQNRREWISSDLRVADRGEIALWTGCAPYFDVLFEEMGVNPVATLRNAVRIMNRLGIEPVILADERCCGHDLLWLGDVRTLKKLARHNINQLQSAGVKEVVFLCPECLRTFKVDYPQLAGTQGMELKLKHISEFLLERGFKPEGNGERKRVTYLDPCRLSRHLGVEDAPRQLIVKVNGIELVEMEHNRNEALCCGGTSWLECGAAVKLLQDRRLQEWQEVKAETLITGCGKCEIHLRCAQMSRGNDKAQKIVNLIDFLADKE